VPPYDRLPEQVLPKIEHPPHDPVEMRGTELRAILADVNEMAIGTGHRRPVEWASVGRQPVRHPIRQRLVDRIGDVHGSVLRTGADRARRQINLDLLGFQTLGVLRKE
jgi:hypothetical protein